MERKRHRGISFFRTLTLPVLVFVLSSCVRAADAPVNSTPPKEAAVSDDQTYGKLSIEELRELAEEGDVAAMTRLAAAYRIGRRIPKDEAESLKWYLKAAEEKHPDATYLVGLAHLQGRGVKRDLPEAVKWFERAAGLGHAGSMGILATLHRNHPDYADPGKARHWLIKSAEAGLPASMYQLGLAHLAGDGVEKDSELAHKWLNKAADAGHPAAAKLLNRPDPAVTETVIDEE